MSEQDDAAKSPTGEELLKSLEERGITKAKLGGFDVDGVLAALYPPLSFFASIRHPFLFCNAASESQWFFQRHLNSVTVLANVPSRTGECSFF